MTFQLKVCVSRWKNFLPMRIDHITRMSNYFPLNNLQYKSLSISLVLYERHVSVGIPVMSFSRRSK